VRDIDPRTFAAIDTLIGFKGLVGTTRDLASVKPSMRGTEHPADYMYREIPALVDEAADVVAETLAAMDSNGIAIGLIPLSHEASASAATEHPDRFWLSTHVDPIDPVGAARQIRDDHVALGTRAVTMFPAGSSPQIPVDDPKAYVVYATCCELGLPIFVTAGVPGPRVPANAQHVLAFDRVCYDFPELTIVMRHGAEPWEDLAVKLMLKWPGLHYSTSAFAPRHYPSAIIDYANTRGADKVLYAGYYPYALQLDRIFDELAEVPLREEIWERFLRGNAERILSADR
jgi:predicted TIM-barrel fold metal-dependent hydrolase